MADETSTSSKEGGKNLQWMYEGAKSVVNREDYLLGKKIDKNFELFSDVVVRDQEEEKRETFFQESILHPSTSVTSQNEHKVSALDTRIVRTEDPLVALKFQEEQRRRQLLENPVLKLKAQRVLRKAFEKELKKVSQKKSKKREKHSSPSSSSPSAERREKEKHHRHRREGRKSERRASRNRSDSRNERRRSRSKTRTSDQRSRAARTENSREVAKKPASPIATQLAAPPKKLTVEELEEKRRAMLTNASWRDDMRERNLREAADKLRKEREEMATSRSAGFMRPMMNTATEDSSIEKRLQSNRMNIQRQHDHMDKSFIKK